MSFLAAVVLYVLSVGSVRGFAFTLGLTTLVDIVVVFMFTKPMVTILARTKFYGQGHKWSGLDPEPGSGRPGARCCTPTAGRRGRVAARRHQHRQGGVMCRLGTLGARLYRGEVSYDFVGRRRIWYTISATLLLVSIVSLLFRGLTLGIEFRGGAEFRVTSPTVTQSRSALDRGRHRATPRSSCSPSATTRSARRPRR